jgi:hypothetical protein
VTEWTGRPSLACALPKELTWDVGCICNCQYKGSSWTRNRTDSVFRVDFLDHRIYPSLQPVGVHRRYHYHSPRQAMECSRSRSSCVCRTLRALQSALDWPSIKICVNCWCRCGKCRVILLSQPRLEVGDMSRVRL